MSKEEAEHNPIADLMDLEDDELGAPPTEEDAPEPDTSGTDTEREPDIDDMPTEGTPDSERAALDAEVARGTDETPPDEAAPVDEEVDWQTRAREAEERLARLDSGFQATVARLRGERRELREQVAQMQPQAAPTQAQPQGDIPLKLEFDDEGNLKGGLTQEAIQALMQQAQPQQPAQPTEDEMRAQAAQDANYRQAQLYQDQQGLMTAFGDRQADVTRVFEAGSRMDQLLSQKLVEMGIQVVPRSVQDALTLALGTGVDKELAEAYPDLNLTGRAFEDLLEGWMVPGSRQRRFSGIVQGINQPDPVPPALKATPTDDNGQAPAPRPRPLAQRGRGPDRPETASETRLNELEEKGVLRLTPAEAQEYKRLVAKHAGTPNIRGVQR